MHINNESIRLSVSGDRNYWAVVFNWWLCVNNYWRVAHTVKGGAENSIIGSRDPASSLKQKILLEALSSDIS